MYGIYVADNDLFSRSTPRRFLCGIATLINEPVCVTPRIVAETTKSVNYLESQQILNRLNTLGIQDRSFRARVLTRVETAITEWIEEVILSDEGPVRCIGRDPESHLDALEWASRLPRRYFKRLDRSGLNNDIVIIAESIASGAELVLSNNMGTIDQFQLNQWIQDEGIRNRPLLQSGETGVSQLLNDRFTEYCHRAAICMTLSYEPRSPEEDADSVRIFASRLRQSFALCANTIEVEELRSSKRDDRWEESRQVIDSQQWSIARNVETLRLEKVKKAVQNEGLEL